MQEYELTVLVHPDLESKIDQTVAQIKELVATHGGKVTSEENTGKKRLAYTIKRQDFAVYLAFDVELPSDAPLKLSNTLNISDFCLRYLLVKIDEKERAKLAESKKRTDVNEERE